ncbi:MAG: neutral zinc metallopeptidase [Acidobacteria bacterium]|nr:neutral zinc metallopeptidase [Acidobacteriota bacterium]
MLRGRESDNIEDLRDGGGFGGRTIALGGGGLGMIVVIIAALLCGVDPRQLLDDTPDTTQVQQPQSRRQNPQSNDDQKKFAASVLGSTEDVWGKILPEQAKRRYTNPKLVLFTDRVDTACGYSTSATGPFYCPGDQKLYLDFAFFSELKDEFRAPGDFAQAYVIAHEVGHHVQNLLGTMSKVDAAGNDNRLSVALELQADCYAGVWAYYANKQGLVEAGDYEEALRAAASVGDDTIQKRSQGYVVPDSFTHGSSRDRVNWFAQGLKSGDMRQCNTFGR